jgi:hypothetical protein
MTGKRNQRELLWFQTGGALNFITAAPHCRDDDDYEDDVDDDDGDDKDDEDNIDNDKDDDDNTFLSAKFFTNLLLMHKIHCGFQLCCRLCC